MQSRLSEIEEQIIYQAFLELGGSTDYQIQRRALSEVESRENQKSSSSESGETEILSDSELSTNSFLAIDNCLDDDIEEEETKELSSE